MNADSLGVAWALEGYVRVCARMLVDSANAVDRAHLLHEYRPMDGIDLPKFELPDAGWKYFSPKLADRIRGFPDSITDEAAALGDRWQQNVIDDRFELVSEIERLAIKFGQQAWALAQEVRLEFGLPTDQVFERMAPALGTIRAAAEVQTKMDQQRAAAQEAHN